MVSVFENGFQNFFEDHITYCAELRIILKTCPLWQGNLLYGNNFDLSVQVPYIRM